MAKLFKIKNRSKSSKGKTAITIIISLISMTAAAFALAILWQGIQDVPQVKAAHEQSSSSSETETFASSSSSSAVSKPITYGLSGNTSSASSAKNENEIPPEESKFNPPREGYEYAVKETKPVELDYFDDAIFFGDSITTGIASYNLMSNASVAAYTGLSTVDAISRKCIDMGGEERLTLLEAAETYGDKSKVYIMLGGNSLGYDKETFIDGYSRFVDAVTAMYPNAVIYIQSMTPVTDNVSQTYPSVSHEIVNDYNLAILQMAKEKRLYFVDSANALMDENGKLPSAASPVDGMHFGPEYYLKWFDYLMAHTVPEKEKPQSSSQG